LSKVLNGVAVFFFILAVIVWVVLGFVIPGGVDRAGQPLNPDFYQDVGYFWYFLVGTLSIVPAAIIAAIGMLFRFFAGKLAK
jgi:ABC-type Fe3+ transport system permease subunit